MALGADRAIHLVTDGAEWDPQATAAAIVGAIREDEEGHGHFDLVVFGNESADAGNFQVGIRVAYALAVPSRPDSKACWSRTGPCAASRSSRAVATSTSSRFPLSSPFSRD